MDTIKTPVETAEERHFQSVKNALSHYGEHAVAVLERMQPSYTGLPAKYKEMLPDLEGHFEALRTCIGCNEEFLLSVSEVTQHDLFANQDDVSVKQQQTIPTEGDMDKVRSLLRMFVRDWSIDGSNERDQCYTPLIRELEATFPVNKTNRGDVRVLVPGCGLGRLAWEISQRGFCTQGNEMSLFMLLGSDFVLNRTTGKEQCKIYPFVHQTANVAKRSDMIREIRIPDVCPPVAEDAPQNEPGDFSMVAGDFREIYSIDEQEGKWKACVTCFFLDTGANIFEYVEAIYHLLPVGGHWLNLGPLLYHLSDNSGASVEVAADDLRNIVVSFGFDIVSEETHQSTYAGNPRSMLHVGYKNIFFHAVKTGRTKPGLTPSSAKTAQNKTRAPVPPAVFPVATTTLASEMLEASFTTST